MYQIYCILGPPQLIPQLGDLLSFQEVPLYHLSYVIEASLGTRRLDKPPAVSCDSFIQERFDCRLTVKHHWPDDLRQGVELGTLLPTLPE